MDSWAWMDSRDSDWDSAFNSLPGGPEAEDSLSGERWQYMGTVRNALGVFHTFRHRRHPETGQRRYHEYPASETFINGHVFKPM